MRLPLSLVLAALLAFSSAVTRASVFNVDNTSCSGAMSLLFTSTITLDCQSSLTLDGGTAGGTISADTQLNLTALDALYLNNVRISAPVISLTAGSFTGNGNSSFSAGASLIINNTPLTGTPVTSVSVMPPVVAILTPVPIGGGASFSSGTINLQPFPAVAGTPTAGYGSITATFPSNYNWNVFPVPEPGIYADMLTGLTTLAILAALRRKWQATTGSAAA